MGIKNNEARGVIAVLRGERDQRNRDNRQDGVVILSNDEKVIPALLLEHGFGWAFDGIGAPSQMRAALGVPLFSDSGPDRLKAELPTAIALAGSDFRAHPPARRLQKRWGPDKFFPLASARARTLSR